MKKGKVVIFVLLMITGCAAQRFAFIGAEADPNTVGPGSRGIVRVKFVDPKGLVSKVTATVREAPELILYLNDRGMESDETAGDYIWTSGFEVPYDAPAGRYHLEIEIFDKDGGFLTTVEEGVEKVIGAVIPVVVE